MSPTAFARRVRVALGLCAAGTLLIAAGPRDSAERIRADGITFTYRLTSGSADKKAQESINLLATVRILDGDVRMDYLEGVMPMGKDKGFALFQGASGNIAFVMPAQQTAMIVTPQAAGSGLGAMMDNPMMKVTYSGETFRFKDMGAGDKILGYATRRVRTWTSSTVSTKMMMVNRTVTTTDSTDYWFTAEFDPALARNLENWSRSFVRGMQSTNAAVAAEIGRFQAAYAKQGIALRSTTYSTVTDSKGKVTTDSIQMEVSSLTIGALDPALFRIPSGYTVTDMTKMMADMKAGASDAAKADGEGSSAKGDESKDAGQASSKGATDAIKKGLGGLLKKKPPM